MQQTVLFSVLASVVTMCFFMGLLVIGTAYWEFRKTMRGLAESVDRISRLDADLKAIPEMMRGLIKICESLVESTVKFGGSVDGFRQDLFGGKERSRDIGAYQPYTDVAADRAYEAMRLQEEEGFTAEEVRKSMAQEEVFKVGV